MPRAIRTLLLLLLLMLMLLQEDYTNYTMAGPSLRNALAGVMDGYWLADQNDDACTTLAGCWKQQDPKHRLTLIVAFCSVRPLDGTYSLNLVAHNYFSLNVISLI